MDLVAAAVGQGEPLAAVADRGEQVEAFMKAGRDDVDDLAFAITPWAWKSPQGRSA